MPMKRQSGNSIPGKVKTKRAYLWAYRSNSLDEGSIVVFDYQGRRAASHAQSCCNTGAGT